MPSEQPYPNPAPEVRHSLGDCGTQTVHLIGGPFCGQQWAIPANCTEFYGDPGPDGTKRQHYRYDPHSSARFQQPRFIYADLQHDLYAR